MQDIRCFETDTEKIKKLEYKFTNDDGDKETYIVSCVYFIYVYFRLL